MIQFAFQTAAIENIPSMHNVRMAVKENTLSNPFLVTEKDYAEMVMHKGNGWVCFADQNLVGFAVVDLSTCNIWALFVTPGFDGQGIGKNLHDLMLDWSFEQTGIEALWLSTAPNTRAELFYQIAGWENTGITKSGEIRFEIDKTTWIRSRNQNSTNR